MRSKLEGILKAMYTLGLDKIELSRDSIKKMLNDENEHNENGFAYILESKRNNMKFIDLEMKEGMYDFVVVGVVKENDLFRHAYNKLIKKKATLFQKGNKYLDVYEVVKQGEFYNSNEAIEVYVY